MCAHRPHTRSSEHADPTPIWAVRGNQLAANVTVGSVDPSSGSLGDRFGNPEIWWGTTFHGNRATIAGDIDGNGRADLLAAGDGFVGAIRSQ